MQTSLVGLVIAVLPLSLSGASGAALSVSLVQEEGHRVAGRVRVPARIRWWGSSRRPRAAPQRVSKLALHSIGHSCDEIWITPAALLFCILWSENRVTVLFTVAEKEANVGLMILLIPAKITLKGVLGRSQNYIQQLTWFGVDYTWELRLDFPIKAAALIPHLPLIIQSTPQVEAFEIILNPWKQKQKL